MKKIALFISMLTILGLFNINGQDNSSNSTKIIALCDSIASFNKLSVNAIYLDGSVNKQFEYFNELLGLMNCNELIELWGC